MPSARFFIGDDRLPIFSDGQARNGAFPSEARTVFSAVQVPDSERMISRGGDGPAPVWRYRYGVNPVRVALEHVRRLSAIQVPDPQRLVNRGRDRTLPVGAYRHRSYPASMTFERARRLAAF